MRKNHNVAERQNRIGVDRAGASGLALLGHYIILSGEFLIDIEEMAARRFSFKKASAAATTASRSWSIIAARAQALVPLFSLRSA
jgi:hypothetical protein